MSDNHTTGNPDYPSRTGLSFQIKVEKITENVPKWIFPKLRKNVLLENIFENLEKYQFWKKCIFDKKSRQIIRPQFDLEMTFFDPFIFPKYFQIATFLAKMGIFWKFLPWKFADVIMSHRE